jgi:hypothetical protein
VGTSLEDALPRFRLLFEVCVALLLAAPAAGAAATDDEDRPKFPTTEFAEDATTAAVTVGNVTATVTMVPPTDPESGSLPVLTVAVDGIKVAEATGTETDFDTLAAHASIAEMDPGNDHPEVYFSSYSGGAHCCNTVIVAEQVGDTWAVVPVGDFDGDGDYLDDLDGDGVAEIATVDNRFLYAFDSYAASAAPLVIYTVRAGAVVDITTEPRFLPAHRDWLKQIEDNVEPAEKWSSPGFLAGWLAEKIRVGEGAAAWQELNAHWNLQTDAGMEVCLTGADPDDCPDGQLKTEKFPEALKLFLTQNGYTF